MENIRVLSSQPIFSEITVKIKMDEKIFFMISITVCTFAPTTGCTIQSHFYHLITEDIKLEKLSYFSICKLFASL